MAELYSTTKRDFMKAALAATSLFAGAGMASGVSPLIGEHQRIVDEYNAYRGDVSPADDDKFLRDISHLADRMASAPVATQSDALEVMRFVDRRLADDGCTDLDRALIHNVLTFMEA